MTTPLSSGLAATEHIRGIARKSIRLSLPERRYTMMRKLVVTLAIIGVLSTGTATGARAVHGGMGMHGGHMGMGMRAGHVGVMHRGFVHHNFAFHNRHFFHNRFAFRHH